MFEVKVDVSDAATILKNHGLEPSGRVQEFFTSEVMRKSAPYTPFDNGVLEASARISKDKEHIEYHTPYARYHWYGKLMVDPITGKGAFFSPDYGFWSRPNTQKVLTNTDLNYQGAPLRGARWVERAWIDNKDDIISATEKKVRSESK